MNEEVILERLESLSGVVNEFIKESRQMNTIHVEEHRKIWVELATLKVKATVWGAGGGILAVIGGAMIYFLQHILSK